MKNDQKKEHRDALWRAQQSAYYYVGNRPDDQEWGLAGAVLAAFLAASATYGKPGVLIFLASIVTGWVLGRLLAQNKITTYDKKHRQIIMVELLNNLAEIHREMPQRDKERLARRLIEDGYN